MGKGNKVSNLRADAAAKLKTVAKAILESDAFKEPPLDNVDDTTSAGLADACQSALMFCMKANESDWLFTPIQAMDQTSRRIQDLVDNMKNVAEFKADNFRTGAQNIERKSGIARGLITKWNDLYNSSIAHLNYEAAAARDVTLAQSEAKRVLTEFQSEYGGLKKGMADLIAASTINNAELGNIIETARNAIRDVGITNEAKHFQRAARWSICVAAAWFVLAGVSGVTAYIVGSRLLASHGANYGPQPTAGLWLYWGLPRFFLLSLLFTGVIFSLRQFSAACHNVVVNRHRQNALSTFQTFVAAAGGDQQIKHAVLLQATQAIFSPQQSGYLKGETDASQSIRLPDMVIKPSSGGGQNPA